MTLKKFLEKNKELINNRNIIKLIEKSENQLFREDRIILFNLLNTIEEQGKYNSNEYIIICERQDEELNYYLQEDGFFTYDIKNSGKFNKIEAKKAQKHLTKKFPYMKVFIVGI